MILTRHLLVILTISVIAFFNYPEIDISHSNNNHDSFVFGESSVTNLSVLFNKSTNASFNAEGTINTLLFPQDELYDSKTEIKDVNTNFSSKYLIGGKWRVDVLNGNITYFKSNFTMIDTTGENIHFHTIVYKPGSHKPADQDIRHNTGILYIDNYNNSVRFYCNVNIYTNNVLEWENVPLTVSFINQKIISIDIKDKKTQEHFLRDPLYGLITSIDQISQ